MDQFNLNFSITDLFKEFYRLKYILLSILLVIILSLILYINQRVDIFKGTITVLPKSNIEMNKFFELNAQVEVFNSTFNKYLEGSVQSKSLVNDTNTINYIGKKINLIPFTVSNEFLREMFIEEFKSRSSIMEFLKNSSIVDKNFYQSDSEYEQELNRLALEVNIQPPILTFEQKEIYGADNYQNDYTISYVSANKELITRLFDYSLNNSNKNALIDLNNLYKKKIKLYRKILDDQLRDIQTKIDNASEDYNKVISSKLAFLYEQLEIAKSLNIEEFTSNEKVPAYFLRGYKSIEKEISLIKNRETDIPYIDDKYLEKNLAIQAQKRQILQDKSVERLEEAYLSSPINSEDFQMVLYNTNDISFNKIGMPNKILLVIALIFYIALSFLIVSMSIILKNQK